MRSIFIACLTLCLFSGGSIFAQNTIKVSVDENGIPLFAMEDIHILAKGPNRKQSRKYQEELRKFNKLRYNVLKVWPYANEAAKNLIEIDAGIRSLATEQEKKAFLKSREHALFGKYEKDLRDLTFSQGKVLIKLVDRQTGHTTYSLIKDLKSGTAAFFWQSIGRIFGYNLKDEYDPNEEDFAIEVICKSIENGSNASYYDIIQAKAQ